MRKKTTRLFLGSLLSVALLACNDPRESGDAMEPAFSTATNPTLVECPTDTSYEAEGDILATGGSVTLRGHRVTLPLGAVLSPTRIGLREPASQFMQLDLSANSQEHYQFRAPVQVTIDYSRCTRNNIDKAPLSVWNIDPVTGALLQNMGGVDDKESRTITFETDHFSGYAIAN